MKNSKKGFSLIECMIAIVLIAIISATAISAYYSAQKTSNNEWEKFIASTVADDSLSAFQSADTLEEFSKRILNIDDVVKLNGMDENNGITKIESVPFKTIRAYENGVIKFYDHTIDPTKNTYTDEIASFTYNVIENFAKDVHTSVDSLDNSEVYVRTHTTVHPEQFILGKDFTGMTDKQIINGVENVDKRNAVSIQYYTNENNEFRMKIEYVYEKSGYTGSTLTRSVTDEPLTALDNYLFSKGQILGFPDNAPNKSEIANAVGPDVLEENLDNRTYDQHNFALYFYVYSIPTDENDKLELVKDSNGNRLVLRVKYYHSGTWSTNVWDDKDSVEMKEISYAYVAPGGKNNQAKYLPFTMDNGDSIALEKNWKGLPSFLHYAYSQGTVFHVTPNYNDPDFRFTIKGAKQSDYTDYVLNPNGPIESLNIDYVLYKTGETKIYSSENDTLLYEYTGDAKSVLEELGFTENGQENGYTKYQKVSTEFTSVQTGYFYYLPDNYSVGCFIKVSYSDSYASERKIQAWILKKDKIAELKSKDKPEEIAQLLPLKPDYLYRKG